MHGPLQSYYRLSKPGIVRMVMITAALGYIMATQRHLAAYWQNFLMAVAGIGMAAAGSAALNNLLERRIDARMQRTCHRELPMGRIAPVQALGYGLMMSMFGAALVSWVSVRAAGLVLLTNILYVLVYTPMKRVSWLNTTIGAIPGALPMSIGWVAANDTVDLGAWILFIIMFAWQHPHFYAIAWLYREDYKRGGLRMLSVTHPDGALLFIQVILYSLMLAAVSLMPFFTGLAHGIYLAGALLLGAYMLLYSFRFVAKPTDHNARRLLYSSLIYLPGLLLVVIADVLLRMAGS